VVVTFSIGLEVVFLKVAEEFLKEVLTPAWRELDQGFAKGIYFCDQLL
jgi:hypothetical protein